MRNNTLVAAAVAGVLASAAASATVVDVYASGASAQRTFWFKEMGAIYCGGPNAAVVYAYLDTALTINNPDFQAATCNVTTSGNGLVAGQDTLNLHYAADLGSVWAIAGSLNTSLTRSQMVIPATTAGCTSASASSFPLTQYNCNPNAVAGGTPFTRSTDSGGTPFLIQHTSDLLLSDLEPQQFVQADNWPTASAGTNNNGPTSGYQQTADTQVPSKLPRPTATQLANTGLTIINGEVFSFIGSGIPSAPTGLSSQSLAAIFQGFYSTWNQVPEIGNAGDPNGTTINVCRRDHGSGTEIAASIFLTKTECNLGGAKPIVSNATFNGVNLLSLVENASSNDLKACVTNIAGSIGILSLGTSSKYTTLNVDGIQPNAHNAALGAYKFATETFGKNISGSTSSGTEASVAGALFSAAQNTARLAADGFNEAGSTVNGAFTVNSGTAQQPVYSLPPANTSSSAAYAAASPTAVFTRKGASCTQTAQNGNLT